MSAGVKRILLLNQGIGGDTGRHWLRSAPPPRCGAAWQVVREALTGEAAQPLCANSIEAALMQGLTAHGALVY